MYSILEKNKEKVKPLDEWSSPFVQTQSCKWLLADSISSMQQPNELPQTPDTVQTVRRWLCSWSRGKCRTEYPCGQVQDILSETQTPTRCTLIGHSMTALPRVLSPNIILLSSLSNRNFITARKIRAAFRKYDYFVLCIQDWVSLKLRTLKLRKAKIVFIKKNNLKSNFGTNILLTFKKNIFILS